MIVDVGACGSNNDGGVFQKSVFGRQLTCGKLDVPIEGTIPQTDIKLPFMFVADDAFPLRDNIMKPFSHRQLTREKEIFNNRLPRARNVVEASLGRIAQMWRILQRPMEVQPNIARDIVKAITVLHNFVILQEPERLSSCTDQSADNPAGFQGPDVNVNSRATKSALNVRETLMRYFTSSVGSLPCQDDQCVTRPIVQT